MTNYEHQSWIMQIRAGKSAEFDLPGALARAVSTHQTLWLTNRQFGSEIAAGDRVYLWSSGVKGTDGKLGMLIGVASVVDPPEPHAQHDWQAEFRVAGARSYDPRASRVELAIDALVEPPLERSEVLARFPEASEQTVFFRNGHTQTMARVEPELDRVLDSMIQERRR